MEFVRTFVLLYLMMISGIFMFRAVEMRSKNRPLATEFFWVSITLVAAAFMVGALWA